jgi:hypothetical protein
MHVHSNPGMPLCPSVNGNPTPHVCTQARFFDWITALAVRQNAWTHIQYRHDPTVLGWDLLDDPMDPTAGSPGDLLQACTAQVVRLDQADNPNAGYHSLAQHLWLGPCQQCRRIAYHPPPHSRT